MKTEVPAEENNRNQFMEMKMPERFHQTLVREQSALQVDLETFEGNPPEFKYFMSIFPESFEKKICDSGGG